MSVVERVEYRRAGADTVARRAACIDSQVFGCARAIRAFGIERFKNNCHQMVNGFNFVLHNMFPKQSPTSTQSPTLVPTFKEIRTAAAATAGRAKANVLHSVNRT